MIARPSSRSRFSTWKTRVTSAAVSAEVASSRMSSLGLRASALAISTIWRRDSGRLETGADGFTPSAPARARASVAIRRCARPSMKPQRRGGSVMQILSATLRCGISDNSWKMQAMPAAFASLGLANSTSWPSSSIRPASRWTTPAMILMRVDLPAPFSPSNAWMRPRLQAKSTPLSAWTPPNRFDTPTVSRIGPLIACMERAPDYLTGPN